MPAALPPRVVLAPPLLAPRVVLAPPGAVLVEAAFLLLPLHAANPTMTPATTIPLLMQLFRMTAGYRLFGLSGGDRSVWGPRGRHHPLHVQDSRIETVTLSLSERCVGSSNQRCSNIAYIYVYVGVGPPASILASLGIDFVPQFRLRVGARERSMGGGLAPETGHVAAATELCPEPADGAPSRNARAARHQEDDGKRKPDGCRQHANVQFATVLASTSPRPGSVAAGPTLTQGPTPVGNHRGGNDGGADERRRCGTSGEDHRGCRRGKRAQRYNGEGGRETETAAGTQSPPPSWS